MDETGQQSEAVRQHTAAREATIRRIFRLSLILKAIDSVIEMAAGLALYLIADTTILAAARWLTYGELARDPRDLIANFLMHSAEALSVTRKDMAALYLLSHGGIKLFLVIMVLRDKGWAYPVFLVALALLIAYQSYQISYTFSPWLIALTLLDAVVLVLTWHEYRLRERERQRAVSR